MDVGGQRHALAALPPGMTRYPLFCSIGGRVAPGPDLPTPEFYPFSLWRVAIPTALSRPTQITYFSEIRY